MILHLNILKDRRTVAQKYFFGPVTTSGRPDTIVFALGDCPFQALKRMQNLSGNRLPITTWILHPF